jgi:hypothetical protein
LPRDSSNSTQKSRCLSVNLCVSAPLRAVCVVVWAVRVLAECAAAVLLMSGAGQSLCPAQGCFCTHNSALH